MDNLLTTKQVYNLNKSSKSIALRWARNNGVEKYGRDYMWNKEQVEAYGKRNHRRGRIKL